MLFNIVKEPKISQDYKVDYGYIFGIKKLMKNFYIEGNFHIFETIQDFYFWF